MITYVSYATPQYYGELEQLLRSADAVGVPCVGHRVPDFGGWEANTRYKACFLAEMLEYYMEPIVWVDADARFVKRPTLFDELARQPYDLGVHYRDDDMTRRRGFVGGELLSGTMYWAPTETSFELLELWNLKNQRNWNQWEQRNLQDILVDATHARVYRLPKEYAMITGRGGMGTRDEAVIEHTQASRRLKK